MLWKMVYIMKTISKNKNVLLRKNSERIENHCSFSMEMVDKTINFIYWFLISVLMIELMSFRSLLLLLLDYLN